MEGALGFVGATPSIRLRAPSLPGSCDRRTRRGVVRMDRADATIAASTGGAVQANTEVPTAVAAAVEREVPDSSFITQFGFLPPLARKGAVVAMTAAAAMAGGSATHAALEDPPTAATAATALIGAGAGVVASRTLLSKAGRAAKRKLADIVIDPESSAREKQTAVAEIQTSYGLSDEEFRELCVSVYRVYLNEMVYSRNGEVAFKDCKDVLSVKRILELTGDEVGQAHYETSRAFYFQNRVLIEDSEDLTQDHKRVKQQVNKMLFLSDRIFDDGDDPPEAKRYEMGRIAKCFGLSVPEIEESRLPSVSLPFYRDVVARALVDGSISTTDLKAAQEALGVREVDAATIRVKAYETRLDGLVTQKGKFDAVDEEALTRLRGLLNITEEVATSALQKLALPVYRQAVVASLQEIAEDPDVNVVHVYGKLMVRRSDLKIPSEMADQALAVAVREGALAQMSQARTFLRAQNVGSAVQETRKALKYADSIVKFLECGTEGTEPVALLRRYMGGIGSEMGKSEPLQLYRLFLGSCMQDFKISMEAEEELRRLRALLGLSEQDAIDTFRSAAGPLYQKKLAIYMEKDQFDEEARAAIDKTLSDLSLPRETAASMNIEVYKARVAKYSANARILTNEESELLKTMREFLELDQAEVEEVHRIILSPIYEQSVNEAMGSSGILIDEYREALETLRKRLGISKDGANQTFYKVSKGRMRGYVDRALVQLEKRQKFRGQDEQRDVGDDPFIRRAGATLGIDGGGVTVELANLVDFYSRNKLIIEKEVETDEVDEETGEKKTKTEYDYPVNIRSEYKDTVLTEVYRQYLIQCFTAGSREEKEKLFNVLDQLSKILGLEPTEVSKIHSDIGAVIYKQYVNQALATQGKLEDKDMQFLRNIESTLMMTEAQCAQLIKDCKENRVSVLIETTFARPNVVPEMVAKVRTTAVALGVDLVKDLQVSRESRKRMFTVEIDHAIENLRITESAQGFLGIVKDGLQVEEEDAKAALLEIIQRRSLGHMVQAAAAIRRDSGARAITDIQRMLRFGRLLPTEIEAAAVSASEKQEMLMIFQAHCLQDGQLNEQKKQDIELVKVMLGFTG